MIEENLARMGYKRYKIYPASCNLAKSREME